MENLKQAIDRQGGLSLAARQLGISPQRLLNWMRRGSVPTEACATVERVLGVSRMELRPEDWRVIWPELVK
jgi:DNA-binding transcriptional regulator YdaS (Cro superfamily)